MYAFHNFVKRLSFAVRKLFIVLFFLDYLLLFIEIENLDIIRNLKAEFFIVAL